VGDSDRSGQCNLDSDDRLEVEWDTLVRFGTCGRYSERVRAVVVGGYPNPDISNNVEQAQIKHFVHRW
jgi:hypothetical protein